jgi:hypothetical protein
LTKLCSISLVATAIANSPELNYGQGVLHGVLQTLHYDLIDMHKLTPKIQEVVAFTKWLTEKQIRQKRAHMYNMTFGTISLLGVGTNLA